MFLCKSKIQNTYSIFPIEEEKAVLHQLSIDDINKEYKTIATKKEKAIILASHYLFEKALDLIPIKKSKNKENSDPENLLQFR